MPVVPGGQDGDGNAMTQTMRNVRDESGNILVLTALSITLLVSILAIAVDAGYLFYNQRQLQTLADAAAMAGALEVNACSGTHDCGVITTAAKSALTESGVTATINLKTQCAAQTATTGVLLTVNNGPCALGAGDTNNLNASYVEAVVAENKPTFFATVFGVGTVKLTARAEAGKAPSANGACMHVLGATGQTLLLNSNASIVDAAGQNCGIGVDSNGTPAVMIDSNVTVNVSSFNAWGTATENGNMSSVHPLPTTGVLGTSDPFKTEISNGTIAVPTTSGMTTYNISPPSSSTTLYPGYYPNGINFNSGGGGYTVTLSPGVYYMGGGVNIGSNVTIKGTGVTIYMGGNSQLNMNSNPGINLPAPTTGSTAGMVSWEAQGNNSQMNLDSNTGSAWNGAIYLPSAQLTLNSNAAVGAFGMIAAQSVTVNSNASITLSCQYMPGGICPGGGGTGNGGSPTTVLAE